MQNEVNPHNCKWVFSDVVACMGLLSACVSVCECVCVCFGKETRVPMYISYGLNDAISFFRHSMEMDLSLRVSALEQTRFFFVRLYVTFTHAQAHA